jgi:hypothetical protein
MPDTWRYISWIPEGTTVPFTNGSGLPTTSVLGAGVDDGTLGPATLFFATQSLNRADQWSILNCSLQTSSYTVLFNFSSGYQNLTVLNLDYIGYPLPAYGFVAGRYNGMNKFVFAEPEARSSFAIMNVLGDLLVGSLYKGRREQVPADIINKTRILETTLAFTQEIYPLYENYTSVPAASNSYYEFAYETDDDSSTAVDITSLPTLASAIEQLVQNMTLALFAEPALLTTTSNLTASVTTSTFSNIYAYNAMRLLAAYSIALGLAFIAVLVGGWTIFTTGASYSNSFSTIVRVAQDEELSALIEKRDRGGEDPLPGYIGTTVFRAQVGEAGLRRRKKRDYVGVSHDAVKESEVTLRSVS